MLRILTTFVLLAGLLPAPALAESPRVAFVNVSYLVDNSPQAKAASARLQEKFGPQQQALQEKKQEFQQLRQELEKDSLVMSESDRQDRQRRLQELQREIQRNEKAFRDELNGERNSALQDVRDIVMSTVEEVAQEADYDLVMGQGAVYADDAINLTSRVLDRMEERFESASQ